MWKKKREKNISKNIGKNIRSTCTRFFPTIPKFPLIASFRATIMSRVTSSSRGERLKCKYHNAARFVICSIDEDGPWNATKEIITPHNDTFYTVENLRPFTVYSFRVAAINALGRSKPSQASYYMVTLRESKFHDFDSLYFLPSFSLSLSPWYIYKTIEGILSV